MSGASVRHYKISFPKGTGNKIPFVCDRRGIMACGSFCPGLSHLTFLGAEYDSQVPAMLSFSEFQLSLCGRHTTP